MEGGRNAGDSDADTVIVWKYDLVLGTNTLLGTSVLIFLNRGCAVLTAHGFVIPLNDSNGAENHGLTIPPISVKQWK